MNDREHSEYSKGGKIERKDCTSSAVNGLQPLLIRDLDSLRIPSGIHHCNKEI